MRSPSATGSGKVADRLARGESAAKEMAEENSAETLIPFDDDEGGFENF